MSALFPRIGIIGKPFDPQVKPTINVLVRLLLEQGVVVCLETQTYALVDIKQCVSCALSELGANSDLIIVVGGDGTMLGAARSFYNSHIPLLGINMGRLGFLTDVSPKTMRDVVTRILGGEFQQEKRFLLEARVGTEPLNAKPNLAMNDVVVHKWNTARLVEFEIHIDDHFVNIQHSDGLVIATPTGSTGYALSGGGPLLHPSLDAIVLVSVCPHTLSHRPLVVAGSSQIAVRLCEINRTNIRMSCDGLPYQEIGEDEYILISKAPHPVTLLHPQGHDHYDILRAKLNWGGLCIANN